MYEAALSYLYGLAPRGMQVGLGRVEQALAARGHPERACPTILVAGTNGKGSVATMIAAVLQATGLRVGLFTSPHLHRLVERFRIAGRPVAERAFARKVLALRPFLEDAQTPPLTFFEVCTLLAFELFRDARCDLAVLEVGMGGRLDATNVVTPCVSVITSVALDHTERLGPTLRHIAREKAGIIKPGVPIVTGVRAPEALRVIADRARRLGAPLRRIDRDFGATLARGRLSLWCGERRIAPLTPPFPGAFQADNIACAVAALEALRGAGAPLRVRSQRPARAATRSRGLNARPGARSSAGSSAWTGALQLLQRPLDDALIRRGLARARWPGRLELLIGTPAVLCDAAHNPHACEALARHLALTSGHYRRRVLLFGVMRDKDQAAMLGLLRPHVDALVFTSVATPRAEPADVLAARYGGASFASPQRAFARARKLAGKRGLVVVCGSIFVMAAVRALVLGLRADPPIAL